MNVFLCIYLCNCHPDQDRTFLSSRKFPHAPARSVPLSSEGSTILAFITINSILVQPLCRMSHILGWSACFLLVVSHSSMPCVSDKLEVKFRLNGRHF